MRCLVCVLLKNNIVCKDDMGLIVVTIKHFWFVLQQPILIGWD